ncbi:hypothetical protein [Kytococcus sedentarius]|uniref:hypothetical protein n=1 Tax=Kytococcus sedentarius TaxID=1276 RepID=UPI0035BBD62D
MAIYRIRNGQSVARPPSVDLAVKLMWLGAALELLGWMAGLLVVLGVLGASSGGELFTTVEGVTMGVGGAILSLIPALIAVGLWLLHAWANGQGMNWARITGTVLGVLAIVSSTFSLLSGVFVGVDVLTLVGHLVTIVLAAVIIWLMWRGENRAFYA